MPEVASRVVRDLGASDLALDAFSPGIFEFVRSTGAPRTPRARSTGVRIRV